jgi:hypothetical protein
MIPMLTTSLHLEIARLRNENERLREQRDALLSQEAVSSLFGDTTGMHQPVIRVFMTKVDWDRKLRVEAEGTKVFPSIDALKLHTENTERGVVELEMRLVSVVEPGAM